MLNLHLLECTVKGYDHISDLLLAKYWVITGCKYTACNSLRQCYCYATQPPSINAADYPSFPKYGNQTILYVPLRYGAKYNTSRWGTYFKNIKEIEK